MRIVESTATAPAPPFVAGPNVPRDVVQRLQDAFAAASRRPWFAALSGPLALQGFAPASRGDYAVTLDRARAAEEASYPLPA